MVKVGVIPKINCFFCILQFQYLFQKPCLESLKSDEFVAVFFTNEILLLSSMWFGSLGIWQWLLFPQKSLNNLVLVVVSKQNLGKKKKELKNNSKSLHWQLTYDYMRSPPYILGHNYYLCKSWKHLELFLSVPELFIFLLLIWVISILTRSSAF